MLIVLIVETLVADVLLAVLAVVGYFELGVLETGPILGAILVDHLHLLPHWIRIGGLLSHQLVRKVEAHLLLRDTEDEAVHGEFLDIHGFGD